MSKLTFRADEDLIDRVEALKASKSEVMRAALRRYLDTVDPDADGPWEGRPRSLDALVAERVDRLVEQRLAERHRGAGPTKTVATTGGGGAVTTQRLTQEVDSTCFECGAPVSSEQLYCTSCGESSSTGVFCDCGNELRLDWSFCPSCGRRTPAAETPEP